AHIEIARICRAFQFHQYNIFLRHGSYPLCFWAIFAKSEDVKIYTSDALSSTDCTLMQKQIFDLRAVYSKIRPLMRIYIPIDA
ncbi:MAG: hypothetical protein ACPG80_02835, partial [Rickettsiales bacterium]